MTDSGTPDTAHAAQPKTPIALITLAKLAASFILIRTEAYPTNNNSELCIDHPHGCGYANARFASDNQCYRKQPKVS